MYYKVKDAIHAVANVDDYSGSARLLAATTLRNVLGTLTLGDILCQREAIARENGLRFYETSAMTNLNINTAFMELVETILDKTLDVQAPIQQFPSPKSSTRSKCCSN